MYHAPRRSGPLRPAAARCGPQPTGVSVVAGLARTHLVRERLHVRRKLLPLDKGVRIAQLFGHSREVRTGEFVELGRRTLQLVPLVAE